MIFRCLSAVLRYFLMSGVQMPVHQPGGLVYDTELAKAIRQEREGRESAPSITRAVNCHYPACLIKDAKTGQMICDEGRNCQN